MLKKGKKFIMSESVRLFVKTMVRVLIICAIFGIFCIAYFVAEDTFSNPAYDRNGDRAIEVVIKDSDTETDVADQLKDKKLINGTWRFRIRKYFSRYKDESFVPGTYYFYQSQGMDDIISILCGEHETEEIQ